jgi:hypothetical protein
MATVKQHERQPLLLRPTGDAHGHSHGGHGHSSEQSSDVAPPSSGIVGEIERYFKVRERGTTIKTEVSFHSLHLTCQT